MKGGVMSLLIVSKRIWRSEEIIRSFVVPQTFLIVLLTKRENGHYDSILSRSQLHYDKF